MVSSPLAAPTVCARSPIKRCSSFLDPSSKKRFSPSQLKTCGTGTMWFRRKYPPSPSTPPFSWPSAGVQNSDWKTPMRSECHESHGLLSLVPPQNLLHCTLKVVIPHHCKYSTKIEKRSFMRFQKRLLAGVRKGAMKRSSTGHAAHAKYVGQLSLAADIRVCFIPVHLRFSAPIVGLRNERLALEQP